MSRLPPHRPAAPGQAAVARAAAGTRRGPARPHRSAALATAGLALGLLAACAGPRPPVQLYHLRTDPPSVQALTTALEAPRPGGPTVVQLLAVRVPDYLDRDALVLPTGRAGLQAWSDHRWAEPLRDAVPRLLRSDLALLRGPAAVWASPPPAGTRVDQLWRVEILTLEADPVQRHVELLARIEQSDPQGRQAAQARLIRLRAALAGDDLDAVVAAHRQVLWQLAETLAATAPPR